jgi:hypothetical protein
MGRNVTPLKHIILIPSKPVFALSLVLQLQIQFYSL